MHAALTGNAAGAAAPAADDGLCWLALAFATGEGVIGVVSGPTVLSAHPCAVPAGLGDALPRAARSLLEQHPIGAIACVAGPGGFAGIRTSLALAHGIALARDLPLIAVAAGEVAGGELAGAEAVRAEVTGGSGDLAAVVRVARARRAGTLPPLAPVPLYGEPAAVTAPTVPDRPPPRAER